MATGPVSRIVAGALAAAALLLGPPVFGQSPLVAANGPAAADEGAEAPSTVVITGSRIASPNMSSTSPIQVVGEQEIKQQGTTDIVDLMNNLPQVFQNTAADFSNTPNPLVGPGGVTTAALRGIGPQRTLVLIDGRRLGVGDANTGNPNHLRRRQHLETGPSICARAGHPPARFVPAGHPCTQPGRALPTQRRHQFRHAHQRPLLGTQPGRLIRAVRAHRRHCLYGATCVITPRWRHTMRVGWETPWNVLLSANWRYFASVQLDSNSAQPTLTQTPFDNSFDAKLPSVSYLDLSAIWTVRNGLEVRAGVNNVLDKDPPLVSSLITGTGAPNTYPTYDLLGRILYVGAALKL